MWTLAFAALLHIHSNLTKNTQKRMTKMGDFPTQSILKLSFMEKSEALACIQRILHQELCILVRISQKL